MRYKQLFEQYHAPPAEQVARDILENCQPFLKIAGNNKIFRGTKESTEDFFVGTVNKNRIPRDSDQKFHDDMIAAMDELGFKAHRGNSLFCTGDIDRASYYGEVFVIFPIGEFNYAWAPEVYDLLNFKNYDGQSIRSADIDELIDFVDNEYKYNEDFKDAFYSGNEIMIACDKYYAISDKFYMDEVRHLL